MIQLSLLLFIILINLMFLNNVNCRKDNLIIIPSYAFIPTQNVTLNEKNPFISLKLKTFYYKPIEWKYKTAIAKRLIFGKKKLNSTELNNFQTFLNDFLILGIKRKQLPFTINSKNQTFQTFKSNYNGISEQSLLLPANMFVTNSTNAFEINFNFNNISDTIKLINNEGIGIISDIDDTIKDTTVYSIEIAKVKQFLQPFQPVKGMVEFYQELSKNHENISFHYVSGGVIQFIKFLKDFLKDNSFPLDSLHLQQNSAIQNGQLLLAKSKVWDHKINSITNIIKDFPKKKFILIGDSGEKDPEIYNFIYNEFEKLFPNKNNPIIKILIRKVPIDINLNLIINNNNNDLISNLTAKIVLKSHNRKSSVNPKLHSQVKNNDDLKYLNSPERFAKAFINVPPEKIHLFNHPKELINFLDSSEIKLN